MLRSPERAKVKSEAKHNAGVFLIFNEITRINNMIYQGGRV